MFPPTRQNATGTGVDRMNALAQEGTGGVKAPAATDWARVIVVFGSATRARSSQLAAAARDVAHASKAAGINVNRNFRLEPVIFNFPISQRMCPRP
jgi:hypothetical protein